MIRVGLGVGEADQDLVALFYCRSLEIEHDFRKEWIAAAKLRDDEPYYAASAARQGSRLVVRAIADFIDNRLHTTS
jgi:hypothetical protein